MPVDRLLSAIAGATPETVHETLDELIGPCLVTDLDGTISRANDAFSELLGRRPEPLVGTPIRELVPVTHRRAFRETMTVLARRKRAPRTFLTRLERRGGRPFDVEVRAARVDAAGTPPILLLSFRDVTETLHVEGQLWELNANLEQRIAERTAELEVLSEELDRRRSYLEAVLHHIPAGIVIADVQTGDVTMANARAREIIGAEPGEPANVSWTEWTRATRTHAHEAGDQSRDWPLARALHGERVSRERVILVSAHGNRRMVEVSAAPVMDSQGEVVSAVALFQDVTAAEARMRATAEFVTNAAHELRTPLASIVSGIEVLESGAKEIPAERDRFLAHVGREAARLARLSGALLLLARLQSGVEEPRAEIVELAPLLDAVAAGLRPAEGVRIAVRCPSNAAAIANLGLLEQAVTSLATNAVRYTDTGRITLSVARPNAKVRIRVKDTGRGMLPEVLDRAGERFYRGDPAGPAGFGLGLAIARESVELMGGSLLLDSHVGEGTTADIVLPAARLVAA
jgi:two-component system phosphate regulon sensor histidine kinase PhoR